MKDWKIRLEEKLKKSVVELTGNISCIVYNKHNDYFNSYTFIILVIIFLNQKIEKIDLLDFVVLIPNN